MKNIYISAIALIFGGSFMLNAQTPNPSFINPSFESWTDGDLEGWETSNAALQVSDVTDGSGNPMVPVIQETEGATDGTSYVKITTYNVANSTSTGFFEYPNGVNGALISQDYLSTEKYTTFTMDVKFDVKANDSAVIIISAFNSENEIKGQGLIKFGGSQTNFSKVLIKMKYMMNAQIAGYKIDIGSSESRILWSYETDAVLGSWIAIDNIIPGGTLSTSKDELKNTQVNVYPNPATNFVNFKIEGLENGTVTINSITGQKVVNTSFSNGTKKIDVNHLNNGVYIYTVHDQNGELIKTDKLIIPK